MAHVLEVGLSPCPNDTFMFHGLVHGLVGSPLSFTPWFADIEELNRRALGDDPLPVTKLSVAVLGQVVDRYELLPAGAALGRGVGPLVVAREPVELERLNGPVAVPGRHTTAQRLFDRYGPDAAPVEMGFETIMPAVARGEVGAGVIIHEGRFTYRQHGLVQIADLGERWENDTGLPLPLGVIVARRDLGRETVDGVGAAMRRSVEAAFAEPGRTRGWVRDHAQELDGDVCDRHIELYVNEFSIDLGAEGRAAIEALTSAT